MLVAILEQHDPATGKVTELGRLLVANDGTGDEQMGHYEVRAGVGTNPIRESRTHWIWHHPRLLGRVEGHDRRGEAWDLVAKALAALGYGKGEQDG